MLFSTRIVNNPSNFKTNLLKLKSDDIMTGDSAMGKFNLSEYEKPHCLIAGGIGVSPIRSFLKQIDLFVANNKNNGRYYISGALSMVKFITQRLLDSGIEKNNIKTDLFVGY